MRPRRLVSVLAITGLLVGALASSAAGARSGFPSPEDAVGPLVASLQPPTTTYQVVNADSWADYYYEVYWDETTAGDPSPAEIWGFDPEPQSCGDFYPNSYDPPAPVRPTGEPPYRENSAIWDHPNGIGPGLCPHEGTDHPGLVTAEVWEGYVPVPPEARRSAPRAAGDLFDDYYFPPLPRTIYFCEFEGSETGQGDPCEIVAEPLRDFCRFHLGRLVIASFSAAVVIQVLGGNLLAEVGDEVACTMPMDTLSRISILGGGGDDTIQIDWKVLETAGVGLNLAGGVNTLSLLGSPGQDWFGLHGIPSAKGVPGGLAFDFNKDGLPDFSAANVQYLNVNLGGGNDTVKVFPEDLYSQFGSYGLNFDGGGGADKAMMLPSGAGRYNFGTEPSQPGVAMVNLDSDQGDSVDVMGTKVETWFAKGTGMADVFTGAGGAGTGGTFQFKLKLSGAGGNDKLTGGAKNDVLNGGAGSNDVCKGGKGRDTAKGCEKRKGIPRTGN